MPLFHPATDALAAWLAQPTTERSHRLTRHLADCARCRGVVAGLRKLPHRLSAITAPEAPPQEWQGIVQRLKAGQTVLIPTPEPTVRRTGRHAGPWVRAIAAMLLVSVGFVVAIRPGNLQATHGELRASPAIVERPGRVEIRYTPLPALAGEEVLRLRGRFRRPSNEYRIAGVATRDLALLQRQRDGSYLGSFEFPDDAVIAILAIEDTAGRTIDTNRGRYWRVATGRADSASADARQQYAYDQMESNWPAALEDLRRLAISEPDNPWRWAILLASETATPALLVEFGSRFAAFESAAVTDPTRLADPDFVVGMELLATLLAAETGDQAYRPRATTWRAHLIARHPRLPLSQDRQVIELATRHRTSPMALLEGLEQLHASTPAPHHARLLAEGLGAAIRARDTTATERWTMRWLGERGWEAPLVAERLLAARIRSPGLDSALERTMALVDDSGQRDLGTTSDDHAVTTAERQIRGLALQARAAMLGGDTATARSSIEVALNLPQSFESARMLDALLRDAPGLGDRGGIAALLALDPLAAVDSAATAQDAAAIDRLAAIVTNLRVEVPIASRGRTVLDADGREVALSSLLADPRTLVMSFHPYCPYSRTAATELTRWQPQLTAAGIRIVVLTSAPAAAMESHRAAGGTLPPGELYRDPSGDALGVLGLVGTPDLITVTRGIAVSRPTSSTREAVRRAILLTRPRATPGR